jgi:hypothetical protein
MSKSALISQVNLFGPNLTIDHIKGIMGNMATHEDVRADLTFENEFYGREAPQSKIVKMSKKEHVDSFFSEGKIQLGTFKYFQTMENEEARDPSEGMSVLAARNSKMTLFGNIGSGFNHFVFCAFDGNPTNDIIKRFGYDDAFEIVNPLGFSNAIKMSIGAIKEKRSRCIYKKHKALVSELREDYKFNGISANLSSDLAEKVQYFIKHDRFSHQQEYRFIWEVDEDRAEPFIITCPEAIKFCKRV